MRQTGNFRRDTLAAASLWSLWSHLAVNDLRGRFARTMLGYGWLLATFAIWAAGVGLVYARLFNLDSREFVPFLTLGFALWGALTASFTESSNSFLGAAGYVRQFNLPKQVYIFRTFLAQMVSLGLSLVVCFIVLAICGRLSVAGIVLAIPGMLMFLAACLLHGFVSAYLTPYMRDFPHAIGSVLSVVFFLTPIIYPVKMLADKGLDFVYRFNPFYYLLEVVREPLLTGHLADPAVYIWGGIYLLLLAIVAWVFCGALDKRLVYAL